jgi:non-ribosomal peptide synthetase component F
MPYGVSEQMIDTWSEIIFDLSLNVQIRRGDPVRHLDHEAWQAQREDMGLTDPEIALKLGLATEQVTFIRNITERRRFRLNQYRKLYRLGGGMRYREDRYQDPEEKFEMSDAAVHLRQAIDIPADQATHYIREGYWGSKRVPDVLEQHAQNNPDALAVADAHKSLTWRELKNNCFKLAASLQTRGQQRGDIIVSRQQHGIDQLTCYLATLICGSVFLPVPTDTSSAALASCLKRTGAATVIFDTGDRQQSLPGELVGLARQSTHLNLIVCQTSDSIDNTISLTELLAGNDDNPHTGASAGLAATDPVLLLPVDGDLETLAIFSHQNLTSSALAVVDLMSPKCENFLISDLDFWSGAGALATHLALYSGCMLDFGSTIERGPVLVAKATKRGLKLDWPTGPSLEIKCSADVIATLTSEDNNIWNPLPGVGARTVNPEGTSLPDGETGALHLLSPGQCIGYLGEAGTRRTLDGWSVTGVQAEMNDQIVRITDG